MVLSIPDFATRLGTQFQRWALAAGQTEQHARVLGRCAERLAAQVEAGHVCIPLEELAASLGETAESVLGVLEGSGWLGRPERADGSLWVLDEAQRLYFKRHFDYEWRLARRIARALLEPDTTPTAAGTALLAELFGPVSTDGRHWQRLAAALAMHRHLVVISGGPGTGKTTTVAFLLAALLRQSPDLRIALAAPTGKAASRLSAAISERAGAVPEDVRAALPRTAQTVHRLLGFGRRGFRYHAGARLPIDLLVVDEVSMLDLSLATQLLEAVPDHARILLLGDRDQLEAVESGAVFAQLSAPRAFSPALCERLAQWTGVGVDAMRVDATTDSPLADSVVAFTRTFRFRADSAVGRFSVAVREGDATAAIAELRLDAPDLKWFDGGSSDLGPALTAALRDGYRAYTELVRLSPQDPRAVLQGLDTFRVLTAQREGPRGVRALNERLSQLLKDLPGAVRHSDWYAGRPILITRNDPLLGLSNGDIGVVLPEASGRLRVWFLIEGNLRSFAPSQLPTHETALAMTIHKSQGSEFDSVAVILPGEDSPLLSRELLYTAVTRARHRIQLAGDEISIRRAVLHPGNRLSGLNDRIRAALETSR